MGQAIGDGGTRVSTPICVVLRLKKEMPERERLKFLGVESGLRVNALEFVSCADDQIAPCLRTHADPIDSPRHWHRSVRLDRDLEPVPVKFSQQRLIKLKKGF